MPKPKPDEENSDIQVKLKPIMGIRPGVYLTVLYSFILLFIMFFLLLYPGLKNPGSMIIVSTKPQGAAVRVNDIYMGVSGSRIFVPKGTQTIEVVMPGFKSQSADHEIPGRVFGSRFFPRLFKLEYTLKPADPSPEGIAAAFALYAADFAAWTFAGEPTSAWQVPMSLSEGASRIGQNADEAREELNDILKAASRFTVTKAALRDLIRAKILLDNNGNAPSPVTLAGSAYDALAFISENRSGAAAIFDLLPKETQKIIMDSKWFDSLDKQLSLGTGAAGPIRRLSVSGLNFTSTKLSDVMISETPVPRSLFEDFLNQNPEWKEHKTDYFPDEISGMPEIDRNSVTGITWYAAEAFCKWLSLRAASPNMEIRLPTENEWFLSSFDINSMRTSIWEWCIDPYAPIGLEINASPKAIKAVDSPERSLRGRSITASGETRASLPPDLSSPFVTFRPVYAPKE